MAEQTMSGQGRTALITGGSSGIGLELARCFARDGYRLILVSLPTDQIPQSEERLRAEFPDLDVRSLGVDLSQPDGPWRVQELLQGQQIDVLVNNAGYGEHGFFAHTNLPKELSMINLNISALVALTKFFLPQMLERNEGRIMFTASEASFAPGPLLAVYSATKAFVLSFGEALQNELKDTSVTVTILCPPATDTNFFYVANMTETKAVKEGPLRSPEDVAKDGYAGLMSGQARVLSGFKTKMQAAMSNLLPDSALASMTRNQMEDPATEALGKPNAAIARSAVDKAKSGKAPGKAAARGASQPAMRAGTAGRSRSKAGASAEELDGAEQGGAGSTPPVE